MLRRTEGIVLRTTPYGEADLIVTYLTPDFGLVKAFAKSPRKIKSRFGSSLEPLTHSKLSLWGKEDARMPRLTQSDIVESFQTLRESYGCFMKLSAMLELTLSFIAEAEPNPGAFRLLLQVMRMMERDCTDMAALIYRIKFLGLAGYAPRLKGCARCGGGGRGFYMSQGSVICADCIGGIEEEKRSGYIKLSAGSIRLYETLLGWDVGKTTRVKAAPAMINELKAMLDSHVEYTIAKPLRTREA